MSIFRLKAKSPFLGLSPRQMKELVAAIRENVNVSTHKQFLKSYANSFIGTECVSWMVEAGLVQNRSEGVELGNRLLEVRLILHVKGNDVFKDDKDLYYLIDPVAGTDLAPIQVDVERARAFIEMRQDLPKNDSDVRQLLKDLSNKGLEAPE
ncbi:hypothetical protein RFI_04351, partial [Reticulomyxa filosa]